MKNSTIYVVEHHVSYEGIYRYAPCKTLEDARGTARRWVELDMWDDDEWKEDEEGLVWEGPSDRIQIQTWTI